MNRIQNLSRRINRRLNPEQLVFVPRRRAVRDRFRGAVTSVLAGAVTVMRTGR
jgi:hypothetical protein